MVSKFQFRIMYDIELNLFVINVRDSKNNQHAEVFTTDEFRTFIDNLSSPVKIDNLQVKFSDSQLAKLEEYLELTYEIWLLDYNLKENYEN